MLAVFCICSIVVMSLYYLFWNVIVLLCMVLLLRDANPNLNFTQKGKSQSKCGCFGVICELW